MSLLIIFACIILLILLITLFKINPFLAFIIVSIVAGVSLGMNLTAVIQSVKFGLGKLLGDLIIVIVAGAMLGKLVAESGAAQKISEGLMAKFGIKYIQWALMITGFIIGIPLFYNVGFVLVVPLIFSIAYRFNMPIVYLAVPMLASMSVTHGFLPPHPSPTALVGQLGADMGKTLLYGFIVSIPTVIIAGPIFSKTVKNIISKPSTVFKPASVTEGSMPSLANSIISALLPVILLAITTLLRPYLPETGTLADILKFISDESVVMIIALAVSTYTLGLRLGWNMSKIMNVYSDAAKDVAMILLIIGGAGALKQILVDTKVSDEIGAALIQLNMHPLVMAWLVAAVIRVCIGSASVAGFTAAAILAPTLPNYDVEPSLMVLAAGAGSLFFSHVNDSGFWLFKEYFNLSIKETIMSWSLMETIVSVVGLGMVLLVNFLV
jgi:Gnt-I system high-affinity gluconate transporter